MNSDELKIVLDELNKSNKNKKLIKHINLLEKKDIISILTSKRSLLDMMPKSIILYYEKEILKNYGLICEKCTISDLDLLSKIINLSKKDHADLSCSQNILLNSKLRPEFLYKHFKNYFTPHVILNYSPVPLEESFIFSLPNFAKHVNSGFFLIQPITRKILFKVNWFCSKTEKEWFFSCLAKSIDKNKAIIPDDVLYKNKCANPTTIPALIKYYELPQQTLKYAYNLIKYNEELFEFFLKKQNITDSMLEDVIFKPYLHFYLAHNKNCTDEILIHLHKNNPELNWLYVNTNINLSEHIDYCKYLLESGEKNIVEYNINKSLKNNINIKNPFELLELDICKDGLLAYINKKNTGLETAIHLKYTK